MRESSRMHTVLVLLAGGAISGCAALEEIVRAPDVSLANVEVTDLDFSSQTFRLGFDVNNPNPFPLPVTSVSYGIELDGQRFATGATEGEFTIPANGDGEFAITVQLNLLKSAPQLLYTVRDAVTREIPYSLTGSLGVDIPFAKPVKFESSGEIRLNAHTAKR